MLDRSKQPSVNLCYFCSVATFDSGMPISTFKLIKNFSTIPHYNVYCIFPADGELPRRVRSLGNVTVIILPFQRPKRGFAIVYPIITWIVTLARLVRILLKNKIRIVHFSDLIDLPYYPATFFSGSKSCAHIRMNIENSFLRHFFKIWATLFCDQIICISESVRAHTGLLKNSNTRIVYNPGPDPQIFNADRKDSIPEELHATKDNIIYIANFRPVKGHEHFIQLASIIETARPGKTQFIIVGDVLQTHYDYFSKMQQMIQSFNLTKNVTLIKKIPYERIPSLIKHSAILLHLPNYQEGFGGVILEAMIMGTPVIAFKSGGIAECFTNGVSGFLVEQFDVNEAAEAVLQLLQDPVRRIQMGTMARREVTKFSYSRHFSDIQNIYETLLQ